MRDYLRISTIGHPFLMYFHELNYRSSSVNTDGYGLRYNVDAEGRTLTLDHAAGRDCSLFVGGSTAFGVGATSDRTSISSQLSAKTGETWLNFGGRGFTSTQELLLFLLYRHKLGRIRRAIIFSGVNNLTVYAVSPLFPVHLGGFYFWKAIRQALHDPYLQPFQVRLRRRLFEKWGDEVRWRKVGWRDVPSYLLGRRRPNDAVDEKGSIYAPITDRAGQKELLLISLRRDLENWEALSRAYGFDLVYVLQPLALWAERTRSPQEDEIFAELSQIVQPQLAFVDGAARREVYTWYKTALMTMCTELGIPFHDSNEAIKAAPAGAWIWVDRAHLTDDGNRTIVDWLAERI